MNFVELDSCFDDFLSDLSSQTDLTSNDSDSDDSDNYLHRSNIKELPDEYSNPILAPFKVKRKSYYVKKTPVLKPCVVYIPKPRLLLTDIRRSYAHMFVNVINSLDFPMLYGFLDTYFPPTVEHHSCKFDPEGNNPDNAVLKGKSDIAKFWYGTFFMSPDSVVKVKEVNVHLASNTLRSRIEIQFAFSTTKIFQEFDETDKPYDPYCASSFCGDISTHSSDNNTECTSIGKRKQRDNDPRNEMEEIMSSVHSSTQHLPLRVKPLSLTLEGTFTMFTDDNKLIDKMIMAVNPHPMIRC